MTIISDTWYIFMQHMRISLRQPLWIILNLTQPLMWLVLFGQLFRQMATLPGFPAGSYLQFLAPGVVAMTAIFSAGYAGMGILHDLDFGIIEKELVTPAARTALLLGRVLQAAAAASVQALLALLLAWLMGADLAAGLFSILLSFLAALLISVAFAAVSNGLGILLRKEDPLLAAINFFLMPLMFISTALMPAEFVPPWVIVAARFNPVNWCVEAIRVAVFEGWQWQGVGTNLALLTALAIISVWFSAKAFRARAA